MNDQVDASKTTIEEMSGWLDEFASQRDWEKFHTPKNLAMSIAIEAAEIMELVQWTGSAEPIGNTAADSPIAEEIADVFSYLLRLASVLEIDLAKALALKIQKNAIKYPAPRPPESKQ
ncbi:MAG: nucleotide pyrophosphohydrolase [Planctomycetes bacterium]|jgi:NTP pyrophosphatase (non-canonical NTP hydrolase)|nr:nucleotide pyrophosphohydrolase [Planctomycetota bacterium]